VPRISAERLILEKHAAENQQETGLGGNPAEAAAIFCAFKN
jgi:hypothetical protein